MVRNENHCSYHRRPKSTLGVFYVNWLSQATVETLYEKYWGLRTLNIIILTNFSIRQLKNRKNRWIHTKKHRNTSKVSLLCLFYRNIRIIIFSFRRPQYSYKKSHRGGSRGRVQEVRIPPPKMTCGFLIQLVFCKKNYVVYWCWSRARDNGTPS